MTGKGKILVTGADGLIRRKRIEKKTIQWFTNAANPAMYKSDIYNVCRMPCYGS